MGRMIDEDGPEMVKLQESVRSLSESVERLIQAKANSDAKLLRLKTILKRALEE